MATVEKDLGLITAGTSNHFNSMTVMYGAIGMIWSKDVYFAFIKPERYTWDFIKNNDYFTVSYFPKQMSSIHKVFGYESGRNIDKIKKTGLTPVIIDQSISFEEAEEIYVCKKIYVKQMDRNEEPENVIKNIMTQMTLFMGNLTIWSLVKL